VGVEVEVGGVDLRIVRLCTNNYPIGPLYLKFNLVVTKYGRVFHFESLGLLKCLLSFSSQVR
jgi:hypothetical protein